MSRRKPRPRVAIAMLVVVVVAAVAFVATSGGGDDRAKTKPESASSDAPTYVALGGTDVSGNAFGFSFVDVWPQILYRIVFPRDTTHFNLARSDAASADILAHQVDRAVALSPDLVVLTLVQDVVLGTPPEVVERTLGEILNRLGVNDSTRVFVGTIPLDAAASDLVMSLNGAIARVVGTKHATLVELSGISETDRDARILQIAEAFAAAIGEPVPGSTD